MQKEALEKWLAEKRQRMIDCNKITTPLGAVIDPPLGYTVESWFQHCDEMAEEYDRWLMNLNLKDKEKENE